MINTDIVIIGAGCSALYAVYQAGMLGMRSIVVDTLAFAGGQCMELYPGKPIYDIAGFPKILAKDLVNNLLEQAKPFNPIYYFNNQVVEIEKKENGFVCITNTGLVLNSKIIIIASGNGSFVANKPMIKNIDSYENNSVFYSVKDPYIFHDKIVAIAGGGDSAVDWAIVLQNIAKKVYLIHRREKFRCNQDNFNKVQELTKYGNLEILVPYQILEISGQNHCIDKMVLQNFIDNTIIDLSIDYFLAFFGLKMELGPINNWGLEIVNNKIIVDSSFYQTNIEGIYAIGDISTYLGKLKLIVTGFAEAASVLHHAYGKVFDGQKLHFEYSTTKGIPKANDNANN